VIVLIGFGRDAVPRLPAAGAICGLIVASAAWLLVLPLALVAAAWPLLRSWNTSDARGRTALGGLIALASAISTLLVLVSMGSPVDEHITADGPVLATSLPWVFGLPTAVLLFGLAALRRNQQPKAQYLAVLVALAATGLLQVAALGLYQALVAGELTYYFWKMALAIQVVVLLVAIPGVAHEAQRILRMQRSRPSRWVLVALTAAIVLVPSFGLGVGLRTSALPSVAWFAGFPDALANRSLATGPSTDLLRWSGSVPPSEAVHITLLATRPGDLSPAYADQWFHSLTRTRTVRAGTYDVALFVLGITPSAQEKAVDIARRVTSTDGGQLWVTDAELAGQLQVVLPRDAAAKVRVAP
jgi:hypothetical protein